MTRAKFDADRKAAFCELIAKGFGRTKACAKIGIQRATFSAHYKKSERFRNDVIEAEMAANDVIEMALYNTAVQGNVTAQQVWLYNRAPDRWADKRNIQIKKPPGDDNLMVALMMASTEAWEKDVDSGKG